MATNHAQLATEQLARGVDLAESIKVLQSGGADPRAVARTSARSRSHMKRAEIHALLAIADELSRIGLTR